MRPVDQPGRPDEEPTHIRTVLDAVVGALPPRRVVLAHGRAAPPSGATISGSPRIVLALAGTNVMALPRGTESVVATLRAGEAVVVTERSWNQPLNRHPFTFLTLDFKRESIRYYCRQHDRSGRLGGSCCIHLRLEPPGPAIQHAWHAIEALAASDAAQPAIGDLVCAVLREARRAIHRPPPDTGRGRATWRALCDYIDDHLADELGREDLARRCGIHPNHVSRLFRQQAGERFCDYLARRRLERAASMLQAFDMRIGDVASGCGYRDQAYFANAFRRRFGCSPSAWRRQGHLQGVDLH